MAPVVFRPTGLPHQVDFWKTDESNVATALVGGYGTGKTYSLAVKSLLLSLRYPGEQGMVLSPTYRMLRDPFLKVLQEVKEKFFPELRISVSYSNSNPLLLLPQLGTEILLRSAERVELLKGVNLSWALIDEPGTIKQEAFEITQSRIRRGKCRQIFLAGTPEGINWFAYTFDHPKPGYKTIRARGWHPDVGSYVENQLLKAYGGQPAKLRSYVYGEFVSLFEGLVYSNYSLKAVKGDIPATSPNSPLILTCDFNVNPLAFLVCRTVGNTVIVTDEISVTGTTWDAMDRVLSLIPNPTNIHVYGDATGSRRDTRSFTTDYAIIKRKLTEAGHKVTLRVTRSNPPVIDRVNAVNAKLWDGTLILSPDTPLLQDSFTRTTWKPGIKVIDKPAGETWTHFTDALGYFIAAAYPITHDGKIKTISPDYRPDLDRSYNNLSLECGFM